MNHYVVLYCRDYEGSNVEGVFDCYDDAVAFIRGKQSPPARGSVFAGYRLEQWQTGGDFPVFICDYPNREVPGYCYC